MTRMRAYYLPLIPQLLLQSIVDSQQNLSCRHSESEESLIDMAIVVQNQMPLAVAMASISSQVGVRGVFFPPAATSLSEGSECTEAGV